MLVRDLMTPNVHACTCDQHASDAMRAMDDFDVGCIPIVDNDGRSPIAMVTDRDIALACYHKAVPPQMLALRDVMSPGLHTCTVNDKVAAAERTMRDWQVRRLAVVDEHGQLAGILSLNDIVLAGERSALASAKQRVLGDLQETFAAVCRHRPAPVGVQF